MTALLALDPREDDDPRGRDQQPESDGAPFPTSFHSVTQLRSLSPTFLRWQEHASTLDPGACWPWTGAVDERSGYGHVNLTSDDVCKTHAHRLAYAVLVGDIQPGMTLDHRCRNRVCCNPAHLEPVTMRENSQRGDTVNARHAAQTLCSKGHPLVGPGADLSTSPSSIRRGLRECNVCDREGSREQAAAIRAARICLDMWQRDYVSTFGWSRHTALLVADMHESGATRAAIFAELAKTPTTEDIWTPGTVRSGPDHTHHSGHQDREAVA